MHEITLAGVAMALLPSGAAYLPAWRTLLVADAHFGKAQTFRTLGVPVPEATTAGTLAALSADLERTGARSLVFLGDFLHARRARSPVVLDALAAWRADHAPVHLTLVRGNHDLRAGDPPPLLAMHLADEPLALGPFALCHHPLPLPGAYVLGGHWHPCVTVRGRAFEQLRLPCFWLGERVGVLPAYGAFTGMHPIEREAGDRVYAVAGDAVHEVPAPLAVE